MRISQVLSGNSIEIMENLNANSIDSVVSDIPYGLGFMGNEWDKFTTNEYQNFCFEWGSKALRVLKPGGYGGIFSAPRKYHRMVCGLEDAGFLIKDMINWVYGMGFPKSLDISKAIDKSFGKENEREVIDTRYRHGGGEKENYMQMTSDPEVMITEPVTNEAKQWNGYGTGLKPAHEPIVLIQKPYEKTYAENIVKWGVGALNIGACRIDYNENKEVDSRIYNQDKNITRGHHENSTIKYAPDGNEFPMYKTQKGRWPANLILDPISAEMLDEQSGFSSTGDIKPYIQKGEGNVDYAIVGKIRNTFQKGDRGGASRFFYCAKAYKNERNAGCEGLYWEKTNDNFRKITKKRYNLLSPKKRAKNNPISTLKPINLMRYIVRLLTPSNGIVLDPFAGSGTTGIACIIEGFNYILIEKRKCFEEIIIPKRLKWWVDPSHWDILKDHPLLSKIQIKIQKEQNKSLDTWV